METQVKLVDQRWNSTESATLVRTGEEMVERFYSRCFNNEREAREYLGNSKVGDCFKTGVSAYERVV